MFVFSFLLWPRSFIHGSGDCSQLCLANHHTTTPPVTAKIMQKKMMNPQISERLRFCRSRSSQESGCLYYLLVNGHLNKSQPGKGRVSLLDGLFEI